MESGSTLIFDVADHFCAIAAADVQEIVFVPALTRLPGQPAVIEGFLNLRGRAFPVVKLDRLFDLAGRPLGLHASLLVLNGQRAVALAVDHAEEVASVPRDQFRAVGEGQSFNDCAVAEFDFAGRAVTLLDPNRILLEKERQCLAELRAKAQAELASLETPAP